MKNIILSILFFSALLISSSCKDDDNSADPSSLPIGTLTAKVDGDDFEASTNASAILQDLTPDAQLFSILGTDIGTSGAGGILTISMIVPVGVTPTTTTYQNCNGSVTDICLFIAYINSIQGTQDFSSEISGAGNATIDFSSLTYETGGTAVGTFSATMVDDDGNTKTVTDGKFNVKIN